MPNEDIPLVENHVRNSERSVMSDYMIAEQIRSVLPEIAAPVRPGELVAVWIERAARATQVPASRLRAYWHRKVEAPRVPEYLAIMAAADAAHRRRLAIADLEKEIQGRAEALRTDHQRLCADHPLLARLVPAPPAATEARPPEEVAPRAALRGGRP